LDILVSIASTGPLTYPSAVRVESGYVRTLEKNLQMYIDSTYQDAGFSVPAPVPKSITRAATFDRFVENQLPALVIVSPGITEVPLKKGGGTSKRWNISWDILVGVAVTAKTKEAVHDLCRLWCYAIRACIVDFPGCDGACTQTEWVGEQYQYLTSDSRRSLAMGAVGFVSSIEGTDLPSPRPIGLPAELVGIEVDIMVTSN
jgi:hypothetical protein